MKLVNLTPHVLNILTPDGNLSLPPAGESARVQMVGQELQPIVTDGITVPVSAQVAGDIIGLPDPQPDTIYVVSMLVAQTARRPDVLSPGRLVRDNAGQPAGCIGLSAFV